jgi:hypothetical protein
LSEIDWREGDIVVKGMSTRPVHVESGEVVRFTREALEGMAEQVRTGFVPMTLEHLSILPPMGRWYEAEIVTAEDGADELLLYGRNLRRLRPLGADPDPWGLIPADISTERTEPAAIAEIALEPRNFESDAFNQAETTAPLRLTTETRWSVLPPLEWILVIPVVWGAARFAGSFLDELGRGLAQRTLAWIDGLAASAKDPERDQLVTLRFVLPDDSLILAFIPVPTGTMTVETVAPPALDKAGAVAELAGAQNAGLLGDVCQMALIWQDGEWHLAWWVAHDDSVRVTNWFLENEPDPSRFLGRPLLDLPLDPEP